LRDIQSNASGPDAGTQLLGKFGWRKYHCSYVSEITL
jgi:hypothetical protein